MKKTLVAMAAFAAVSSFAQSSVTLYGRVDAGLYSSSKLDAAVPGKKLRQTGIDNGSNVGLTGSRWGMRGTEDLGGGLKAGFKLENRFNIDNGAGTQGTQAGPLLFGGESFISLQGGFGTVKLGRIFTAYDDLRGVAVSKNNFDSAFTPVGDSYGVGLSDYAGRGDNAIKYESPSFGGFSGALMYAFGENKTATAKAGVQVSGHAKYVNGPLAIGFGLQTEKAGGLPITPALTVVATKKQSGISAAYDLGVVALSGGFNQAKADSTKDTDLSLGVTVPFGAAAISAGFASSTSKLGNAKQKGSGFGLSATYAMSKRTQLYTGIKSTVNKNAAGAKILDNDLFSLGVRHDF